MQLADGSRVYPKGVVEDVLVKVDKLIFPADFFVLDMEHDSRVVPTLLGRPYMKTAQTKIDVSNDTLTMKFDGDIIEHNIHDLNSIDLPSVCLIDDIADVVGDPPGIDSPDEIADLSHNTVLGNRPALLTPQKQIPVSADIQVVE